MTTHEYDELLKIVGNVSGFKQMVISESRRPNAVSLVSKLAGIDKRKAWEFVTELYDNMDIGNYGGRLDDKMKNQSNKNPNLKLR